ncbi:MAG: hypothetical protein JNL84_13615 [Candidatus Accumulibacter sp.]|nr:hypothetical protein [Accumulibacter sp.]
MGLSRKTPEKICRQASFAANLLKYEWRQETCRMVYGKLMQCNINPVRSFTH